MKKLILLIFVIIISCKSPVQQGSQHAPEVIGPAIVLAAIEAGTASARKPIGVPPLKPFVGGPAPAYVQKCVSGGYKTWGELDACLHAPKSPIKFAASGSTPPAVCPAQQVPSWFISNAGSDNNTCVTSGSPCFSPQAIQQRWGCGGGPVTNPTIAQATTITFLDSQATTAASLFKINPIIVDAGSFNVIGTRTVLGTGTLGTVTAKNRAGNQSLNIDLGAGSGGFGNSIIVNTTRGNSEALVDNGALSGNVFRITQPQDPVTDLEVDTWTAGDSFSVQSLPNFFLEAMSPDCGTITAPNESVPSFCGNRVNVTNWNFPNVTRAGSQFWQTSLYNVHVHSSYIGGVGDFKSTAFSNVAMGVNEHNLQNCDIIGGYVTGPYISGTGDPYGAYMGNDVIVHGVMVFPPGSVVTLDAVAVDSTQQTFVQGDVYGGHNAAVFASGVPNFWYLTQPGGTYTLNARYGGNLYFSPTLAGAIATTGFTLLTDFPNAGDALAIDYSQNPVKAYVRQLSISNFSQSIASGGFNNQALDSEGIGGFKLFGGQTITKVPYQAQPFTSIGASPMIAYNPALWLRGDYVLVNGSNRVQYLSDQFAQGRDFNSPISALVGPIWGGTASPTMTFNGSDTFIGHSPGVILSGVGNNTTMFAVVKTSSANANLTIFCTDLLFMGNNFIGSDWGSFNGGAVDSGFNIQDGNVHVLVMRTVAANDVTFFTDGQKSRATNGTSFNSRGGSCGLGGQVSIQQFIGDIDEVALYTSLLSDDAVNLIGTYLSGRWGGTWGYPLTQVTPGIGWRSSAIPALTTGTTTLTQAQLTTTLLTFSGTLTGANTVAFPDRGGYFLADLAGVTFGAQSITFQAGAGSCTAIVAANITGLHQLVTVVTEGSGIIRCDL